MREGVASALLYHRDGCPVFICIMRLLGPIIFVRTFESIYYLFHLLVFSQLNFQANNQLQITVFCYLLYFIHLVVVSALN
jgi:hypothetical protein